MEPITQEYKINLFADNLPSPEEIKFLSEFVHSSEKNMLDFEAELEAGAGGTSARACLAAGIGFYIAGKYKDAVEKLEKANDCMEKFLYLAFAQHREGDYESAVKNLKKSLDFGADSLMVQMEKIAVYRSAEDYDAAAEELKDCANLENVSAEYHYQLGRLQEAQGFYELATDNYQKALELAPQHQRALFHLAYRCDLSGDEEAAIDYYKQIVSGQRSYVSALLNLAVLYEDMGQFDKAEKYIDRVLESFPNHARAQMFKKDVDSSKTMYYDEEKEKKKDRKNQILETPITDFELSVRSRNCLRKMRINTIGDLLNITEAELLSYKNFGETSLREIKGILESKNLRLGMALDENKFSAPEPDEPDFVENDSINADILNKPLDDLQLSVRARKCLQTLNMHTIGELTHKTDAELLGCKNFGVTSLNEIKKAIGSLGLSLRNLD